MWLLLVASAGASLSVGRRAREYRIDDARVARAGQSRQFPRIPPPLARLSAPFPRLVPPAPPLAGLSAPFPGLVRPRPRLLPAFPFPGLGPGPRSRLFPPLSTARTQSALTSESVTSGAVTSESVTSGAVTSGAVTSESVTSGAVTSGCRHLRVRSPQSAVTSECGSPQSPVTQGGPSSARPHRECSHL